MEWFVILVVVVGIWFFLGSLGNESFWKLTRKHPIEAWQFFTSQTGWHLHTKPAGVKVVGPFRVVHPINGELVVIYCEADKIEESQKYFLQLIRSSRHSN